MHLKDDQIDQLLAQLERKPESLLILGAVGEASARESVVGAFSLQEALTIDANVRADLGLVFGAAPDDVSRIARLRDVHCRRVLLVADDPWTDNELLALGFQRLPFEGLRVFLCDPDLTPLREWNNAKHWAHPQNFDKRD
ncbi:MAG: DUF6231 family protein [Pseudomonadota bacterium]